MKYGYIRVSSEEQATKGQSLQAQTELLKPLVDKIIVEAGKSAKLDRTRLIITHKLGEYNFKLDTKDRPEFDKLKEMVKEGDEVYIKSWDRISRSFWWLEGVIMDFEERGVKLIPVRDTIDTLTRMIMGAVAQNEINVLSARIKSSNQLKFNNGKHSFKAPHGYVLDKEHNLIIDSKEAEIVRQIFQKALTMTPQEIADSFPTKPFCHRQTIANILKNPIYCGNLRMDGEIKKGLHIPIISEELFKEVNSKTTKL